MPVTNIKTIEGANLNLATTIRWIAVIPFQQIYPELKSKNIAFNLQSTNFPEMSVGESSVPLYGHQIPLPNFVSEGDKTMTFEYLMSSDWHQFKILFWWWSRMVREGEGAGSTFEERTFSQVTVPITLILLSEFKNPIFEIIFKDCWIKSLGQVSLDYTDAEASNIKHSFSVKYSFFEINDNFT